MKPAATLTLALGIPDAPGKKYDIAMEQLNLAATWSATCCNAAAMRASGACAVVPASRLEKRMIEGKSIPQIYRNRHTTITANVKTLRRNVSLPCGIALVPDPQLQLLGLL